MKRRWSLFLSAILILAMILCGCSASAEKSADYYEGEQMVEIPNMEYYDTSSTAASGTAPNTLQDARKLIKTVDLTIRTETFDEYLSVLDAAVISSRGYVEYSDIGGTTQKWARYTVRIPVEHLDSFLEAISQKGVIAGKSTSQEDVTLQYVDTQAHVTALRTEEESLLRLLEQAESVEDIISIQDRLSGVRYEIESYESQLRTYDNLVDYATVTLNVDETAHVQEVPESNSVWDQIGTNLKENLYGIGQFFRGLFIVLVSALPFFLLIAVILLPILYFTVFRPRKKRKAEKKNDEVK